ncbi:unnamed protein product [Adineta ricciae]|uniref:Uncharacterized protein n=1 Tax=Adineta ricciae TaxID=249248 RepID=A0A814MJR8_ADIRI|nr:unnamed protein product [Adineta ricciae]
MSSKDESPEQLILLVSAIFALISCIMSMLAITTSGWQIDSNDNKTGLFRSCYKDRCTSVAERHETAIVFAILGQVLILVGIISSFMNAFIYQHCLGSICVTSCLIFASSFFWITILTINLQLYLNGGSAIIFNAALSFSLLATFTSSFALGTFFTRRNKQIQSRISTIPLRISSSSEFYRYGETVTKYPRIGFD